MQHGYKKLRLVKEEAKIKKSLQHCLRLYRQLRISILLFISSKDLLSLSHALALSLSSPKQRQLRDLHNNSLLFCNAIQSDRTRTERKR